MGIPLTSFTTMVARTTAVFALLAASSDALSTQSAGSATQLSSHTSRRHLLSSLTFGAAGAAALLAPNAAFASGVSLEEAAKTQKSTASRASNARRRIRGLHGALQPDARPARGPHEGGARGDGQARREGAVHARNHVE